MLTSQCFGRDIWQKYIGEYTHTIDIHYNCCKSKMILCDGATYTF